MKWFLLRGSKKCSFNGHPVQVGIEAESLEQAFLKFRRDFPSAGDPHCIDEREVSTSKA